MLLLNIENNALTFIFKTEILSDIISNMSIELSQPEKNLLCNPQNLWGVEPSYGGES